MDKKAFLLPLLVVVLLATFHKPMPAEARAISANLKANGNDYVSYGSVHPNPPFKSENVFSRGCNSPYKCSGSYSPPRS